MQQAIHAVVARHDALRTTIGSDGEEQTISAPGSTDIAVRDLCGYSAQDRENLVTKLLDDVSNARFDLTLGPLFRARIVKLTSEESVLALAAHHIIADGWAMGRVFEDIASEYSARCAGSIWEKEVPLQHSDHVAWVNAQADGEAMRGHEAYWLKQLASPPATLELPTDHPRPARLNYGGGRYCVTLDRDTVQRLKEFGRRNGCTLFMTLLTGYTSLLHRLSGQDDLVVGIQVAGRTRPGSAELVSYCGNMVPIRSRVIAENSFVESLTSMRGTLLDAIDHADLPFSSLVNLLELPRDASRRLLVEAVFNMEPVVGDRRIPGLQIDFVRSMTDRYAFDIGLNIYGIGDELLLDWEYNSSLFDASTIERWAGHFTILIEAAVQTPHTPISALPLLSAEQCRQMLVDWNQTEARFPLDKCVHELFEAMVQRAPDVVAVAFKEQSLEYAALNARANRLAHHLRSLGVKPDSRVVLCVERGLELVVGLLAILKAGGAYVPLDPAYPTERLRYMLSDCEPVLVLTHNELAERLGVESLGVPVVDACGVFESEPDTNLAPSEIGLEARHLAYVIYTSGSTGAPKGVMVEHSGVVNLLCSIRETLGVQPTDHVLSLTTIAFDIAALELFVPLISGARICIVDRETGSDPEALSERVERLGVTIMQATPATWRMLMESGWSGSRRIKALCGGEALPVELASRLRERVGELWNVYGPTETTIWSTMARVHETCQNRTYESIGRPIANTQIYILDEHRRPTAVGVAGELCIGGAGVARGYLKREELTLERFSTDPRGSSPGARLYKTGDRARWLPDGSIEFLGRTDFQVKIRGFRIELGEIESQLASLPTIKEAVVIAREDRPGDRRLVAYLVMQAALGRDTSGGEHHRRIGSSELRRALSAVLPDYMVPSAFVRLERFPLTANGKLDRRALPAPEEDASAHADYEAPIGKIEGFLAESWSDLLKKERIDRRGHFFELGGHSLLAVQLVSRLRKRLEVELSLSSVFACPVLKDLAEEVAHAQRSGLGAISIADRGSPLQLSFAQQRLWFVAQMDRHASAAYHIAVGLRLRGALNESAMRRALDRIVERHEVLRTRFVNLDGGALQCIDVPRGFPLMKSTLADSSDAAIARFASLEATRAFDLAAGPLIRGCLVCLGPNDHVLLVTMHHIVSDGWSIGIFTQELCALYNAFHEGYSDPLPPLTVQYADYAQWQRQWLQGAVSREQLRYWVEHLRGAPELVTLPTDRVRPEQQDYHGAVLGVSLDASLSNEIKKFSCAHGVTLFMTLLAAWAAVVSRLSGQDEVVIGSTAANRTRAEVEGLIGFFLNTQALRVDLSADPTVTELLAQLRRIALAAQSNQDVPFESILEALNPARSMAYNPIFQLMFTWQNVPEWRPQLIELAYEVLSGQQHAVPFDIHLVLQEQDGQIRGSIEYSTSLFDEATIRKHWQYLQAMLRGMLADSQQRISRISLLEQTERDQVLRVLNDTAREYPKDALIHELFEQQVRLRACAVVVEFQDRRITYGELNARANQLARYLRQLGLKPGARVAVCMERGAAHVEALLAVFKAGGAYVPLDPLQPAERTEHVLSDCEPVAILVHACSRESTVQRLRHDSKCTSAVAVLDLEEDRQRWSELSDVNLEPCASGLHSRHLAYVIYTSGSTGRPKGVMIEHRALVNYTLDAIRWFELSKEDVVLQQNSLSFDLSLEEILPALAAGARLVPSLDLFGVGTELSARPTVVHVTAAHWHALVSEWSQAEERARTQLRGVRLLNVTGDALSPHVLKQWGKLGLPTTRLINTYGPTETTISSTAAYVDYVPGQSRVSIGRPFANTRIYILDAHGQPLPMGATGEMYIGGVGVARGYLNLEGLTAERFLTDPFNDELDARMYRTGDLARWRSDGELEFVGRNDLQVKVRGFRIELGEVESCLAEASGVREVTVAALRDAVGDKRLVAYWVGTADPEQLRRYAATRLPEYMVPAAFVRLEQLPLTPNGKLNRKALPSPQGEAFVQRAYEAPVGEIEQELAAIWAALLKMDRVGRRDNFFEVGGHSLLAMQVVCKVRQRWHVDLAVRTVFVHPVLCALALQVALAGQYSMAGIQSVDRSQPLLLSSAQQRLWFIDQMDAHAGSAYHIAGGLRLRGQLDEDALCSALDRIVQRHEILRTHFITQDGQPLQCISAAKGFTLEKVDLPSASETDIRQQAVKEATEPFDLSVGPLIRGRLLRLGATDHVLLITMHHIVSDGWSISILTRELAALYAAARRGQVDPLPTLTIQYADYAQWQRQCLQESVLQEQLQYWVEHLRGAPELVRLPTDRPRPDVQDYHGKALEVCVEPSLCQELRALSRRHGTTLYMTFLAAWAALVGRMSSQQDVVIGSPVANRTRTELEGLIGFFVNSQALRVDLSADPSVGELLAQVRETALAAQNNQDIPFEQVVEAVNPTRSMAYSPIFQLVLAWQNTPEVLMPRDEVAIEPLPRIHCNAHFDLALEFEERGERIVGRFCYATAIFDELTILAHWKYLQAMLRGMVVAQPDQKISRIDLLDSSERNRVLFSFNPSARDYPSKAVVHELFEQQARIRPDSIAVECGGHTLSYGLLNVQANRLAHHLRSLGVGPDQRVAICAERSLELVVGLLAVLKAGGGYLPLDPAYPGQRLRRMLAESDPVALLTQGALLTEFADDSRQLHTPIVCLDACFDEQPDTNLRADDTGVTSNHIAYVVYTSGSTGTPKGVLIEHRSVANLIHWHQDAFGVAPGIRCSSVAGLGFDAAVWEIWPCLCSGGTLLLPTSTEAADPQRLLGWWQKQELDLSFLPTPMAEYALSEGVVSRRLKKLLTGGDRLRRLPKQSFPFEIVNNYGPTEATVVASSGTLNRYDEILHIGRPIDNTRIYILDTHLQPVPVGITGELYIGGVGIARGYLNQPDLTRERFVSDPFSVEPQARMYKTGDLGRWLRDGRIEFLGRNDFQVKIRGFRVELGEIESRLLDGLGVRDAVVVAHEDPPGDTRLIAYFTSHCEVSIEELRAQMLLRLPEYMVPAAFVQLDRLPLTPNGKIDRKTLAALRHEGFARRPYRAPVGAIEETLAAVWAKLLKIGQVGRDDNFFQLGGHSLLAVQLVSQLRQHLGVELALSSVFVHPVLQALAGEVARAAQNRLSAITVADRCQPLPLSLAQQRMWFVAQMDRDASAAYQISVGLRLRGALDEVALQAALDRIVERHEILRTRFVARAGKAFQCIDSPRGFRLTVLGLRDGTNLEVARHAAVEAAEPFDLLTGPLIRGRLLRIEPMDHVLLVTMHHIISDGWSVTVLAKELQALYSAFRESKSDPLPPLPIQYADYSQWQREWLRGPILQSQLQYWVEHLRAAPELLNLPTDHPRPERQDYRGATIEVSLDPSITRALKDLGQRHGTTLYMTLLAAWAAVVSRLADQEQVVIGSPTANRTRAEVEGLIGFFVNTQALRIDVGEHLTVAELLARVRQTALAAQAHQDVPFEQVVDALNPMRSMAHSPIFQILFSWQNTPVERLELPDLVLEGVDSKLRSVEFDLVLKLEEQSDRIVGSIDYATALFEEVSIRRHWRYLQAMLRGMLANSRQKVREIELLDEDERNRILSLFNATATDFPDDVFAHQLFEQQAHSRPEATALDCEQGRFSFREINQRANRLAHYLRSIGVKPDHRVAIYMERGLEMVVGILAVLKAGGAYVPLDPSYPSERLSLMLSDSQPMALLAQGELGPALPIGVPVIDLTQSLAGEASSNLDPTEVGLTPRHLAYVIYTSGSTGTPKGVMLEHAGLSNLAHMQLRSLDVCTSSRILQLASLSFDGCVFELVLALCSGAELHVPPAGLPLVGDALAQFVNQHGITHAIIPPAVLTTLAEDIGLDSITTLIASGDTLSESAAKRWARGRRFINGYGPTEATVCTTLYDCPEGIQGRPAIGRPIANARVYILDSHRQPVPIGVVGELYVGGVGIARGYLNRAELTAERFLPDSFSDAPGGRMYRTGDLGRWLPNGIVEFLGRNDYQVKIRGFRVELGEIETRLLEHPAVREVVVIVREDAPGAKRLVAYLTSDSDLNCEQLRTHLMERLPEHMLPAALVRIDALPLTPNGKVDRKALPALDGCVQQNRSYIAPRSPIEAVLAGIWARLLDTKQIGVHDNFFDLGGNSLLVMQVQQRIKETLEKEVSIVELFQYPTIAALGRYLIRDEHEREQLAAAEDGMQNKTERRTARENTRKIRQKHRRMKTEGVG